MARIVKVSDNDYRIVVESGGSITLDTGQNTGGVLVTGNLSILGTLFNIAADNTTIKDNIIVLNNGEVGLGITPGQGTSGIEIDRGLRNNAKLLFDETITRVNQSSGPLDFIGAFVLKDTDNRLIPLRTNHINTNGESLYLINTGLGVVSVEGTIDYESKIINDDHIPNKKYVDDAIIAGLADPQSITDDDSVLIIEDTAAQAQLTLRLNNQLTAVWRADYHIVQNIKITDTRIEPTVSYSDLILSSTGTGHVTIDDSMRLKKIPFVPTGLADSTLVYAKDSGRGESGVFFTTSDGSSGELISARRALAFSVIF